jgi:hypothetical protein
MPDQLEVRKMTSFDIRLFHDDASIVTIGEGLLAATLPRAAWTHEAHLAEVATGLPLYEAVNSLLLSARGRRDLPLRFYSKELLFSVPARRTFVPPDRLSLDHI